MQVPESSYYYKSEGVSQHDQKIITSIQEVSVELNVMGYPIGGETKRLMNMATVSMVLPCKLFLESQYVNFWVLLRSLLRTPHNIYCCCKTNRIKASLLSSGCSLMSSATFLLISCALYPNATKASMASF